MMIIEFLPCFPEDRCLRGVEDEEGGGRSAVSCCAANVSFPRVTNETRGVLAQEYSKRRSEVRHKIGEAVVVIRLVRKPRGGEDRR